MSAPLHAAVLLMLALGASARLHVDSQPADVAITYVAVAPIGNAPPDAASSRDPMLIASGDSDANPALDDSSLALPDFDFDITKIGRRRNVLFPFLTSELTFLDTMTRETARQRRHLTNPFISSARAGSDVKPRLSMTDTAFERAVDYAWSRRDRWSRFSEIARVVQAYDPNNGRAAELVHAYRDRNILQPICDYRIVTGPPRRETIVGDHMVWVMLENAADHADFVDFVHAFAREHPSSRTTTELLFIIDKLVQANRDALLKILSTDPDRTLTLTSSLNRTAFDLVVAIRRHYGEWLEEHGVDSAAAVRARYDAVRLRLLSSIVETTPDDYRAGDARFLAGEILFHQGKIADAVRSWQAIVPDARDSYAATYARIQSELRASPAIDASRMSRALADQQSAWRLFSTDRLHQFGSRCDAF